MTRNLKDMVTGDKKVRFQYYRGESLWYSTEDGFIFPVPISDVGDATFLVEDKAILFMRYIRKYLAEVQDDTTHVQKHNSQTRNPAKVATDGITPGFEDAPAPGPVMANGQNSSYWILSEEERAKGFIRPVRQTYKHVGKKGPKYQLRDLTEEEKERYGDTFVKFEEYPKENRKPMEWFNTGKYWTQKELDLIGKGCNVTTTMRQDIAETYATNPHFYGATFCSFCGVHLPVGKDGEFVWEDGTRVGT